MSEKYPTYRELYGIPPKKKKPKLPLRFRIKPVLFKLSVLPQYLAGLIYIKLMKPKLEHTLPVQTLSGHIVPVIVYSTKKKVHHYFGSFIILNEDAVYEDVYKGIAYTKASYRFKWLYCLAYPFISYSTNELDLRPYFLH